MKVTINAGGREVGIECADANTSPKDIAAEALALWEATGDGARPVGTEGPAIGYSAQAARDRLTSSSMRYPMGAVE
jgi:hypothetical protein